MVIKSKAHFLCQHEYYVLDSGTLAKYTLLQMLLLLLTKKQTKRTSSFAVLFIINLLPHLRSSLLCGLNHKNNVSFILNLKTELRLIFGYFLKWSMPSKTKDLPHQGIFFLKVHRVQKEVQNRSSKYVHQ